MSVTTLPARTKLDEHIRVALTPAEKRRLFEAAATRELSASEFVRGAIKRAAPEIRAA